MVLHLNFLLPQQCTLSPQCVLVAKPSPQSSAKYKGLLLLLINRGFLRSMLFWATQQRLFRQMLLCAKACSCSQP